MKTREELQKQLEAIRDELSINHGFDLDKHMTAAQMANMPYTIATEAYRAAFNAVLPLLLDACETIDMYCVNPVDVWTARDKAREFLQSLDTFLKGKT